MIAYVTVGADDIARAKRFYSAFLPALGYEPSEGPEGLGYVLPAPPGGSPAPPDFYVKPPFDGRPASAGNGSIVAFEAQNQAQVRALHAAALRAGNPGCQPGGRSCPSVRSAQCHLGQLNRRLNRSSPTVRQSPMPS